MASRTELVVSNSYFAFTLAFANWNNRVAVAADPWIAIQYVSNALIKIYNFEESSFRRSPSASESLVFYAEDSSEDHTDILSTGGVSVYIRNGDLCGR